MQGIETGYGYWTRLLCFKVILMAFVAALICTLVFPESLIPFSFIVAGLLVVVLYFLLLNLLLRNWFYLSERGFERRLFGTALLIRLSAVLFFYQFFTSQTGVPFEYNAVDSFFYHRTAQKFSDHFNQNDFHISNFSGGISFSDLGYNIYLGLIYSVSGQSLIIPRLLNAIFSSFTVVLIYRIARSFDTNKMSSRTPALMALLLPNFLIYLGTHLKESLMLFLITYYIYLVVKVIYLQKRSLFNLSLLVALLFVLFTFRTVLAAIALLSLIGYTLVLHPSKKRVVNLSVTTILLFCFGYIVMNSQIGIEVTEFISKAGSSQSENMQFRAERDYGNKYALLAGVPLFLSIILMAPFPSFIYVPFQEFIWLFIGANFIRNIYAFYLIYGIIFILRKRLYKYSILLFYAVGYLLILANSPFAISERFHLPAVPGLLILSSLGVTYSNKRINKIFVFYLALLLCIIIGWNYVKMSGRL